MVGCDSASATGSGYYEELTDIIIREVDYTSYTQTTSIDYTLVYDTNTVTHVYLYTKKYTATEPGEKMEISITKDGITSDEITVTFEDWRLVGEWYNIFDNNLLRTLNADGSIELTTLTWETNDNNQISIDGGLTFKDYVFTSNTEFTYNNMFTYEVR